MTMLLLTTLFAFQADAAPRASSSTTDSDGRAHPASHAFDGLLSTAWAEGASGDGAGEWIEVRFAQRIDVTSVSIWPGWLGGRNREIREFG
ncbi:MAG: discoidin domain-containing protein, partial [Myxococcota bacterium]